MAMRNTTHQIKIAAYKLSSPKNVNIDWCLDALLNIYKPDHLSLDNDNLNIYFEQVKSFAPDLIISDLEYFTSHVANELNIALWQYSSSMINYALTRREKYDLGLFKYHAHLLNRAPSHTQRTVNLIDNSDRNLVYSHYGDAISPPKLKDNFEWIRPYHQMGKDYVPCQHYVIAALSNNNKQVLDVIKKYPDSVAFLEHSSEKYNNILVKDIGMEDEYYCNLKNSPLFVCQGQTSFLADAFYNGKFSLIYPDYEDADSITNSQLSKRLDLGCIMSHLADISVFSDRKACPVYNDSIKYLDEYIKEL
jgi:uncharacterized protein (TIGR00661 family)